MLQKVSRGQMAHCKGEAAEQRIARDYEQRGHCIAHRRWRGVSGEVDLITRDGDVVVFVEVKASRTFADAACHLGARQMARLCAAAEEFLAGEPRGTLTDMRFDVALVDETGAFEIVENAFGAV